MPLRETGPGIFYSDEPCVTFGDSEIDFLVAAARNSGKQRARICAHSDTSDAVHEMLICLLQACYIRPHQHCKPESLHVIRGACDLVLMGDDGDVREVVHLSDESPEALRFIRLPAGMFHTLLVRSSHFVFHETTRGPFATQDTTFASWSAEADLPGATAYVENLEAAVREHKQRNSK